MAEVRSFEDLDAWKQTRVLRLKCYEVAKQLPAHERYNLALQIRKAAVSLTANIAEGYGRYHFKENIQCCRIARGSSTKLGDHLITCQDQQYVTCEVAAQLRHELFTFLRLRNGYIRSIGSS